jgi:hypothetical protein
MTQISKCVSNAHISRKNTTLRICALTATTEKAAQRKPGLVLTKIDYTTQKDFARIATSPSIIAREKMLNLKSPLR